MYSEMLQIYKNTETFLGFVYKNMPPKEILQEKVKEATFGVFQGMALLAIENLPWVLSRMTHLRIFAIQLDVLSLLELSSKIVTCQSRVEKIYYTIHLLANFGRLADFVFPVFFPGSLMVRLSIDSLLLLASGIGSLRTIHGGVSKCLQAQNAQLSTSQRVAFFILGFFSTTLGIFTLSSTLRTTIRYVKGLQQLQQLDPEQREHVIKFRAIDTLASAKASRAVIIDGISGDGEKSLDNISFPHVEEIYKHYTTRVYKINSSGDLNTVLQKATKEMGGPIDLISFDGHANAFHQKLGENYNFIANRQEAFILNKYLTKNAQIFLFGCNTATKEETTPPLAERLSNLLPGRFVTGFSAYLNPFIMTFSHTDRRMEMKGHFPLRTGGEGYRLFGIQLNWAGFSNDVSYAPLRALLEPGG